MKTMLSQRLRTIRVAVLAAAAMACLAPQLTRAQAPIVPISPILGTGPARAIGTLLVAVPGRDLAAAASGAGIAVPDAIVWLGSENERIDQTTTGLDGKFRLTAPKAGGYGLCWEIQGRSACTKAALKRGDNYLGDILARLAQPLVFGTVRLADDKPCWVQDPFFALDVSTRLRALDSAGQQVTRTRANTQGGYVLALRKPGRHQVQAACEKAEVERAAVVSPNNGGFLRLDLRLPNRAPRLTEFAARLQGRKEGIFRADPGNAVELGARAHDADNDGIEYLLRANDGAPIASGATGLFATRAPDEPGRHVNYLIARDGRGGYAWRRLDLEVGPPTVRVSGTVVDEFSRQPIAGARVELAGAAATTSGTGSFALSTPETAERRYVLNIRQPGYALLSQVFDRSMGGNTFGLIRAHEQEFDPNAPLLLTDESVRDRCNEKTGADGRHVVRRVRIREYRDADSAERPTTVPGNSKGAALTPDLIQRLTRPRPCLRAGAQILIPAGALVDAATGTPAAAGKGHAAITTIDPTQRPIPGDYQAIDRGGRLSELLSYGAVDASFRDAAGNLLNLKAGATAEVRVPVPVANRGSARPTVDFWSYDEKSGRWVIEGQGTLMNTPAGPVYVARTTHFSTLNMDVAGNDPALSTCVRFEVDKPLLAWSNLRLRATVSSGGTDVITKETPVNGDQYHAVYRIPFGSGFPPNTLRVELFGNFDNQSLVLVDNIINTDARPKMTGTDLWPPYPYTECGDPVVLRMDPVNLPAYPTSDASGRPYFLTGPGGEWLPPNGEQSATDYYNAIGASAGKPTLQDWWTSNGFDAAGAGGTRASYLNHNDLGFGRDMHCRKNGGNVACYVTNYGAPNNNAANADHAASQNPAERGATVAMEFDAAAPAAERVQFYVYGRSATSGLLKFADLDGFGPKPVPQLCQVCHGGGPGLASSGRALDARFREWDLPSLRYPGNRAWDFGATALTGAELDALRGLNLMARDAAPAAAPIAALIDAWYPAGNPGPAPVVPTPPAGWLAQAVGYHNVYGTSCRTCHIARDAGGSPAPFITFNSSNDFAHTSYAVCGSNKVMPNAVITYQNFWRDPSRVLRYELLTGRPANTCKN